MSKVFYDRILLLGRYDAIRMFGLFGCFWIVQQLASAMIEKIIWGETFPHWFDLLFLALLSGLYACCADELAQRTRLTSDSDTGKETP